MSKPSPSSCCVSKLISEYVGIALSPAELRAVSIGASGRCIYRGAGLLGIYWTDERADNASFLPAAHGLAAAQVPVPRIFAQSDLGDGRGVCLVEDLGELDIYSFKDASWNVCREIYRAAFRSLLALHHCEPDWPLQPPFDASLYRWEQAYFAEHFLACHLQLDSAMEIIEQRAFIELAEMIAALPRVPVHRDCQSQNIMMRDGEAWLIDFQGMRMGRPEYDIASLIYDPYMDLPAAARLELLQIWEQESAQPLDYSILSACGTQRIMQALGAFSNIGHHQGRDWYLAMIHPGLRSLRELLELNQDKSSPVEKILSCLNAANIL